MQQITDCVDAFHIEVLLAYYPPYHSKYNPIERVFGKVVCDYATGYLIRATYFTRKA